MKIKKEDKNYNIFLIFLILYIGLGLGLLLFPQTIFWTRRIMNVGIAWVLLSTIATCIFLNRCKKRFNISFGMLILGYLVICVPELFLEPHTGVFFVYPIFLIGKIGFYISRMSAKENLQARSYLKVLIIVFIVQVFGTMYAYWTVLGNMIEMTLFVLIVGLSVVTGIHLGIKKRFNPIDKKKEIIKE